MLLLANAGATVIPAAMSNNYPIDLNNDLLPIGLMAEFVGVVMAKKELPVELDAGIHRLCQGEPWQA